MRSFAFINFDRLIATDKTTTATAAAAAAASRQDDRNVSAAAYGYEYAGDDGKQSKVTTLYEQT